MSRRSFIMLGVAFAVSAAFSWALCQIDPTAAERTSAGSQNDNGRSRETPQRVICMSPAIAEMVFAMKQGERVVGVSQYTTYPPEAQEKPVCGALVNPNTERILTLNPDLIIYQGAARDLTEFCSRNDIDLLRVRLTDMASIFDAIKRIGRALGSEAAAEVLCAEMRLQLARVRRAVADQPPKKVLLVTGREPATLNGLNTAGGGTFLNDLIETAGGRNVFGDLTRSYTAVSKEAVIRRKPDVVVELQGEGMIDPDTVSRIRDLWSSLSSLPAVRNDRVYVIENTYALIPGPRVVRLARKLARLLHPEAFKE